MAASSPKRSQCEMKRGEDGAAVKICSRSKAKQILGTARVSRISDNQASAMTQQLNKIKNDFRRAGVAEWQTR